MTFVVEFYQSHPMWTWLIIAGVILAVEIIGTNTGWLLWTAACAAVVALVASARLTGFPIELGLFGVLSIVSGLTAHRYLKKNDTQPGPDINNRAEAMIGRVGRLTKTSSGRLRVDVDGSEWDAELSDDNLNTGAKVKVTRVISGSQLEVEAA